jgi:hypothetical protein
MSDEPAGRDLVELASAAIEEAARNLPPFPLPAIDATAAGFGPVPERVEVTYTLVSPERAELAHTDRHCRVYWGSHGCQHARGHDGPHECDCCVCDGAHTNTNGCVAGPPYYGPDTNFYGEDAEALGLPGHDDP